jgi:hypothetical protein
MLARRLQKRLKACALNAANEFELGKALRFVHALDKPRL